MEDVRNPRTHIFYRALSLEEFLQYQNQGKIDENKHWAGHPIDGVGFKKVNMIRRWVMEGESAWGKYDLLISVKGNLSEFNHDPVEKGVYTNKKPIGIDRVVEELYHVPDYQMQEVA